MGSGQDEVEARLLEYAMRALGAEHYPLARHTFRILACAVCGAKTGFRLTVVPHSGATRANFRGEVHGECTACGERQRLFRFSGAHRQPEAVQDLTCACGSDSFVVGQGERYEDEAGVPDIFDEGVLVGCCTHCGTLQDVVAYD